jgi:hypothetical protein
MSYDSLSRSSHWDGHKRLRACLIDNTVFLGILIRFCTLNERSRQKNSKPRVGVILRLHSYPIKLIRFSHSHFHGRTKSHLYSTTAIRFSHSQSHGRRTLLFHVDCSSSSGRKYRYVHSYHIGVPGLPLVVLRFSHSHFHGRTLVRDCSSL